MKPSEIQVGKTYQNRGKGTTTRKVLAVDPPLVRFISNHGEMKYRRLSSFAAWAGSEVKE